ncbi:MAG: hypothetical protein ACI8RD_013677, partial [Bacillariaceae sp.]|jgi:hypothetical protein
VTVLNRLLGKVPCKLRWFRIIFSVINGWFENWNGKNGVYVLNGIELVMK